MTSGEVNYTWARAIVDELVAGGVSRAVVCPGSRSTPLALTLAGREGVAVYPVLDERCAAFFGLGLAMATDRPVAVLATSGTAAAHFLPAAIEATQSRVPLVLLTADRPWELHGFGAAQTISQQRLFGPFAAESLELPGPEDTPVALEHLRASIARALGHLGVLHINAPFREPLAPPPSLAPHWTHRDRPSLRFARPGRAPGPETLTALADLAQGVERGLIVCGPRRADDGFATAVLGLGRRLGYPVVAEIGSQVRSVEGDALTHADLVLSNTAFASTHRPDLVLRFGGGLTSKRLMTWLDEAPGRTVVFDEHGALVDPTHRADWVVEGDAPTACRAVLPELSRSSGWDADFMRAEEAARVALHQVFECDQALTEPRIAREVVAALPEGSSLFLSSSMPIREADSFAGPMRQRVQVFANRGANGIDGVTSTALGVSAGTQRPTVLLTGDLAFLHDLGGLLIARQNRVALTIVVVNNDGGGIFSFLPVAQATPQFERLFGMPHGLHLEQAAGLFGARYTRPSTIGELRQALSRGIEGGLHLIEVVVDRQLNPEVHRRIALAVQESMRLGVAA